MSDTKCVLSIFATAVAQDLKEIVRLVLNGFNSSEIVFSKIPAAADASKIVFRVITAVNTKTATYNNSAYDIVVQNVTSRNVRHTDRVLDRNVAKNLKQFLKQAPPTPNVNYVLVFAQRGGIQFKSTGFGFSEVLFRYKTSACGR